MNGEYLTACFHCGLFTAFYCVAGYALFLYHRETKGALALALVSVASGSAHLFRFFFMALAPDNPNIALALAAFYTWAPPTIMLCIKEAVTPGWLTWNTWARYLSPFMLGTIICFFVASTYIVYILIGLDIFATLWCVHILRKQVIAREKRVKEYFTDIDTFGHTWVNGFMYFQVASSLLLIPLFYIDNLTVGIIWNYIAAAYWLYFLLKCRQQRLYSALIPEDIRTDLEKQEENQTEPTMDKLMISQDTYDYIEKRLLELENQEFYLDSSLNLTTLAQIVGTNRTYMSVYFRTKGTTFGDFVNGKRCEHAIDLMKLHPNITMAELSRLCGYKTENCFRTSFSSIYDKTPFVYKREVLHKNNSKF